MQTTTPATTKIAAPHHKRGFDEIVRAVIVGEFGPPPDVLFPEEVPLPVAGEKEVVIDVEISNVDVCRDAGTSREASAGKQQKRISMRTMKPKRGQ